jgi:hypothetical protein
MPLQQGEVRGYDFNRSVVEFTMLDQGKVILCSVKQDFDRDTLFTARHFLKVHGRR